MMGPAMGITALEHRRRLVDREVTAVEATSRFLAELERVDRSTGALLELFREDALRQAAAVDASLDGGETPRALEGIPFTVKANI